MSSTQASAMRRGCQPRSCVGPENPKPGSDGATTWKASAASPPCAVGSVSGPKTSRNSMIEPGQPCMRSSGSASSWRRWCDERGSVARRPRSRARRTRRGAPRRRASRTRPASGRGAAAGSRARCPAPSRCRRRLPGGASACSRSRRSSSTACVDRLHRPRPSVELLRGRELAAEQRFVARADQVLVRLRRRDPEVAGPDAGEDDLRRLVGWTPLRRRHLLERLGDEDVVGRREPPRAARRAGSGRTSRSACRRRRARGTTRRRARRPVRASRAPRTPRARPRRTSTRRTARCTRPWSSRPSTT